MKKVVNIFPRGPITSLDFPIRVPVKNVTKDVVDIRKCIIANAKVEEILNDGSIVELNLNNYDLDNEKPTVVATEESTIQLIVDEPSDNTEETNNTVFTDEPSEEQEKIDNDTTTASAQTDKYVGLTKKQRKALRAKEAQERAEAEAAAAESSNVVEEEEAPVETTDAENM